MRTFATTLVATLGLVLATTPSNALPRPGSGPKMPEGRGGEQKYWDEMIEFCGAQDGKPTRKGHKCSTKGKVLIFCNSTGNKFGYKHCKSECGVGMNPWKPSNKRRLLRRGKGGKSNDDKSNDDKSEGGKSDDDKSEGGKSDDDKSEGGKSDDDKSEGGKSDDDDFDYAKAEDCDTNRDLQKVYLSL